MKFAAETSGLRIVFEGNKTDPFFVVYKPRGMPSAPLKEDETETALSHMLNLFPNLRQIHGRKTVEYGLLHRLDTETEGLLLIAQTQEAFESFLISQKKGLFEKKYSALCLKKSECNTASSDGFPPSPVAILSFPLVIKSLFRPYGIRGATVRPVVQRENVQSNTFAQKKAGNTVYKTFIESCTKKDHNIFQFECRLERGFRHQIRCHLAWVGYPIIGDVLYNRNPVVGDNCICTDLQLYAHTIVFPHPFTGKKCIFSC